MLPGGDIPMSRTNDVMRNLKMKHKRIKNEHFIKILLNIENNYTMSIYTEGM